MCAVSYLMKKLSVTTGSRVPTKLLHVAVHEGDIATAAAALLAGAEVDSFIYETPLMQASRRGHVAMVKLLLAAGANVEYSQSEWLMPLMCASAYGHTEVMQLLLAAGARVSDLSEEGHTALKLAAHYGRVSAVEMLLKAGAPLVEEYDDYCCALNFAQIKRYTWWDGLSDFSFASRHPGRCRAAELLLQRGACGEKGESRLQLAVRSHLKEMALAELAAGVAVDARDETGRTPLMEALLQSDGEMAALLLRHGADTAARDAEGNTCLHYAAAGGNKGLCRRMLKLGNEVNGANERGVTPLMFAARGGHVSVMLEFLLPWKADANAVTAAGKTALQYAALPPLLMSHRQKEATDKRLRRIKLLLDLGADPNLGADPSWNGDLPLHLFAAEGDAEAVRLLLQYGVAPDIPNDNGRTPLMTAVQCRQQHIVEMLLSAGADLHAVDKSGDNLLVYAVKGKNRMMVEKLVRQGFDVNTPRPYCRYTLLGYAAADYPSMVGLLLMLGADALAEDKDGNTVLHCAARYGCSAELIRLIDRYRIPVNKRNHKGETALQILASKGPYIPYDEYLLFALLLLSRGADPADFPKLPELVKSHGSAVTQQLYSAWQERRAKLSERISTR